MEPHVKSVENSECRAGSALDAQSEERAVEGGSSARAKEREEQARARQWRWGGEGADWR